MVSDIVAPIAVSVAIIIMTIIKSAWNGKLNDMLTDRQDKQAKSEQADDMILDKVEQIEDNTESIQREVACVDRRVDKLSKAVIELHNDDEDANPDVIKERMDVQPISDVTESDD